MEPRVLSLAGSVLGITMMVIIIAMGAGIVLGYTYKRSVTFLLGSLRGGEESIQSQIILLCGILTQKNPQKPKKKKNQT